MNNCSKFAGLTSIIALESLLFPKIHFVNYPQVMKLSVLKSIRGHPTLLAVLGPLQYRSFQTDFVPRDPKSKPIRYNYPPFYDPYDTRPPPSDKIIQLAERIAELPPEESEMIRSTLVYRLNLPKLQHISAEGMEIGPQEGSGAAGSSKIEEKVVEKTAFDVKLEKCDTKMRCTVIIAVRASTDMALAEAKALVEKSPVTVKRGVTKEEADKIIEKIKDAGRIAVMEYGVLDCFLL